MLALPSTRMAPHLALRAPLATLTPHNLRRLASTSSSLKLATPAPVAAHSQRSFSTFPALRNSQPTTPVRKEEGKDTPSGFQPHFQDGPTELDDGKVEKPFVSSRPHEDYVWHPVYKPEELDAVKVVRLERKTVTDKLAFGMVKFARWGFDFVTGYKHASPEDAIAALKKAGKSDLSLEALRKEGYLMTETQWLHRILFLESIAGVPGMVAGALRHLRSLRLMKRDNGWIGTLLQEAENERMHLMTFMKIYNPGWLFRGLVLATQGVFYNVLFLSYIVAPSAVHRFVGYLEEEAVVTYTQIVDEMDRGHIPEWAPGAREVPQIAKDYWRMGPDATMKDLILAVRADESNHRCTNHTLADLKPDDVNPFGFKHASPFLAGTTTGLTREESIEWAKKVEQEVRAGLRQGFKEDKKEEQKAEKEQKE